MTSQSTRRHLATILWFVSGMLWVVQAAVPWTRRGPFSSSSMLDGARLFETGVVDEVVPRWASFVLVVVPVLGVFVGATAALRGRALFTARLICVGVVSALFVFFVHNVAGADPTRLGPGAWLTGTGIVLSILTLTRTRHTGS